ncbi:MAG: hypothetical protein D6806_10440 [Deltaproteobacteria bacterium]|nr:MAG: hypothetical protein D6806_10440 [Deltaproteobacteria bacterium]
MKCMDCHHWQEPRSVDALPDYPIGFCVIFQKDVAGEYAGCAGRFFLPKDSSLWKGVLKQVDVPAEAPLDVAPGVKIVSISEPDEKNRVKITLLVPDD